APPQIKETQLPHRTAPIGQIQTDSLNLICWPRGRGIFRDALIQGVLDNTPTLFEPNVAGTLENTAQPIPAIPPVYLKAPKSNIEQLVPPPDPLGEVDPGKSQRFTLVSGINALWKVVSSGKTADENLEGWSKVIGTLGPYAAPILKWLRSYVLGS
ncbi:MAG: hypothetical protein ACR2KT_05390, partial [Methylocella sp.]